MKNTKKINHALLLSVLAMFLCVTMLIGTTFAWFTDTASTAVNKIQAGTLDIVLEMQNADGSWVDAQGQTLKWVRTTSTGTELVDSSDILWEPGCTYQLQPIRIRNNGDLALKYRLVITGILGDARLNEAIVWTNGDAGLLSEYTGTMIPGQNDNVTDSIIIKGHMNEQAGNEYQGLSIDGIGITVVATQLNSEYDSNDNQYDAEAEFPVIFTAPASTNADSKLTEALNLGSTAVSESKPLSVAVPEGVKVEEGITNFDVKVEKSESHPNVIVGAGSEATAYSIEMPIAEDNDVPVKVTLFIGTERSLSEVYHDDVLMSTENFGAADTYQYDPETGVLTMYITHCSTFTCVETPDFTVSNFSEFTTALNQAENGDIIALTADINPTNNFTINKSVIINLNGYGFVRAAEASGGYSIKLQPGCDLTMRNGRWDMAGTFGDISAEGKNGTCNVKYENVVFTNLDNPTKEELANKPGNSSNLVKTAFKANMQGNFNVNATFTNCTFNNASVEFSGFNSDNTYKATFTGCTFNNIGNASAINAYAYGMSENCKIAVTDCTFNITVTSNVSVIGERTSTNKIALELTDNTVNGMKADPNYYKVYASSLKFYKDTVFNATESGTTLQGIATMN